MQQQENLKNRDAAPEDSVSQTVIKINAANGRVADIVPSSAQELREITEKFDDRGTRYSVEFQPSEAVRLGGAAQ